MRPASCAGSCAMRYGPCKQRHVKVPTTMSCACSYFNFSTRIGSSGALIRSAMARPPPVVDSGDNTAGGADAFITTTSLLPNLDQVCGAWQGGSGAAGCHVHGVAEDKRLTWVAAPAASV